VIRALVAAGIPVMGHLGVLPQTAASFKKVGAAEAERARLIGDAREIRDAGVFALVLENVEAETARAVTAAVDVPTIGIGAGPATTGQVQVLHDILGLAEKSPPFAKRFTDLAAVAEQAVGEYVKWVKGGAV
jgi:3-methyl-2-oxobutanoate hydroxymethyltransferase